MSTAPHLQPTHSKALIDTPSESLLPVDEYRFAGDEVTQAKKLTFIQALRTKATVYHSAQVARISRKTAYQWYQLDPVFAEAWEGSFEDAIDVLETSVYERALGAEGNKADPLLAMFWLKAHRKKFRDKVAIDVDAVVNEIKERLGLLDLKQLPPAAVESVHFPLPSDDQQKGGDSQPASLPLSTTDD